MITNKCFVNILKSNKTIILLFYLFFSLGCNEIFIKDIKKGQHLNLAVEKDMAHFLNMRMKNSIKKVLAFNTEIILESNPYLYYGYVKGYEREQLYVEELFKVRIDEVQRLFLGYKKLTGIEIKKEINTHPIFTLKHQSTLIQNREYSFSLSEVGIEVNVIWMYRVDREPERKKYFYFLLDSKNGKVKKVFEK